MHKRSLGAHVSIWERLVAAVAKNLKKLSGMERDLEVLKQALVEVREAKKRQIEMRAAAQQATRDLEAAMEKANGAAVRLNSGILSAYGSKAEKLAEFGLRPWRPRKAAAKAPQAEANAAPLGEKPRKPRRRRGS